MRQLISYLILAVLFISCNREKTLQEFYVEHQNDNQYIAFDIPASLLSGENSSLNSEQKATLETIRKINLLAFPKKEGNEEKYEEEKQKLANILKEDDYKQLMRYGGSGRKAQLYYLGEEDAIDELVVFASDADRGFGIARVTGNDMNPGAIFGLFKSLEKGDLDLEGLPNLDSVFKE